MSVSQHTTQSPAKSRTSIEDQNIEQWTLEHCDYLAARSRFELVLRYRNQYNVLDYEFFNLCGSRAWLAKQDSEEAANLLISYIEVLAPYLCWGGLAADLLCWCEEGFWACERVHRNPGPLLLLCSEAQKALGQWNEAMESVQIAMEVSESVDAGTYARATLALGTLQFNRGDYVTALKTLARAQILLLHQADYERLVSVRSEIAAYYLNRGDLDRALSLYLEIDQLHKQAEVSEVSDHILLMLGVVNRKKRDYEQASVYLRQLFERSEVRQNRNAMATAAHHLAWVSLDQREIIMARRLCGKAIMLYEEIGDERGASDAYEQLGCIALAEGQGKEALPHLQRSLIIRRQLGNQHGTASSLRRLAIAHIGSGNLWTAIWYLWKSLITYQRIGMLSRQRFLTIFQEFFRGAVGRW